MQKCILKKGPNNNSQSICKINACQKKLNFPIGYLWNNDIGAFVKNSVYIYNKREKDREEEEYIIYIKIVEECKNIWKILYKICNYNL